MLTPCFMSTIRTQHWSIFRVHIPPPAQPRIVLPEFRAQTVSFPIYLIVSLLPVEKVPITPDSGTGGFWRVCGGADHGAKIGIFRVGKTVRNVF